RLIGFALRSSISRPCVVIVGGCRGWFRTQPIPRVRVPPRSQPVRVLSPKTRLFVVPVSFEESFTFEDAYRVTGYWAAELRSPIQSANKYRSIRCAVVLHSLNIGFTLHRGSHDSFLFSASRNSSAVRTGLGSSSFGSNRHPPMPLCMRSSHLHSMPS